MGANTTSIYIKGAVLLFAAGFSSGRFILQIANGNTSTVIYLLTAILLLPLIIVDITCLTKIVCTLKDRAPSKERNKDLLGPVVYFLISIAGLSTGFLTFKAAQEAIMAS